jgi:predicted small metal-binding protein
MTYKLACRDMGIDCNYVAKGKTESELMKKAIKHGKEVHGYTDEQLNDPKMMKEAKAAIKKE